MNDTGTYETRADALAEPTTARRYWTDALASAGAEEKSWRDKATKAVRIYEGEQAVSFNILHSNTETIVPAVYNSVPVPDCRTRYGDKNEVARKGAELLERALSYELDEYDCDAEITAAVYDLAVPGRGVVWVNYDPLLQPVADPATGQPTVDADGQEVQQLVWQTVKAERVPWDRFRRGPASSWAKVPWVARLKFFTRDEVVKLAGEEVASAISYDASTTADPDGADDKVKREKTVWKAAAIWEIWDRETRKVWYVSETYDRGPVHVIDDPLNLLNFFPTPRPMQTTTRLVPMVPYAVYSAQAEELEEISERLLKLIKIAKFRGVRASEIPELDDLETAEDGQFVPSKEAMALLQNDGSLDRAIWIMPIDKLIIVIRELNAQRNEIKQTIYELTGISDILRGATNPNETLGAQQIKAQWSSLKVQNIQKEIQRFCRDLFRIKAEIIGEKFEPQVLSLIAGEQVQPDVIAMLRSDVLRRYSIDIETDSTIRADLARNQQQMSNFMQATAQYIQAVAPAVQSGMLPAEAALAIFSAFARQHKLGKQVDDVLAKLGEAAPQHQQQQEADKQTQKGMAREAAVLDLAKKREEVTGQQIENRNASLGLPPTPGFVA